MNISKFKDYLSVSLNFVIGAIFPTDDLTYALESISISELLKRTPAQRDSPYPAVFSYKDPVVRNMILSLKYRGSRKIGVLFGQVMRDVILEDISDIALFEGNLPLLLVPSPISKQKLENRG